MRQKERGTAMHNTVAINNLNSSEVWSGFRVARRANPVEFMSKTNKKSIKMSVKRATITQNRFILQKFQIKMVSI